MTAQKDRLIRRSLRRLVLGSGPLKRRSDHLEVISRFAVVLSFLVAPPLAVAAMTATTAHLQSVAAVEAAERSQVHAVLLEDATEPAGTSSVQGDYPGTRVPAPAEWTPPGGTRREGTILVEPGTPAGTSLPVWVDREGDVTRAPLDPAGIPTSAATIGALPLVGVPLLAWSLHFLLCVVLNARRERRWAQEWAVVEPEWNSRLL